MYLKYFKYIIEHKKNVFKCCIKMAKKKWNEQEKIMALMLIIHAFTHDLSKFRLSEFKPYAIWFYGENGKNADPNSLNDFEIWTNRLNFNNAWKKHYKRNKHHWNHWKNKNMPYKYILQMICDWEAMGIKFGNTAAEYYISNCDKIKISTDSKILLEWELGFYGNEM